MTDNRTTELLPCPFCGEYPKVAEDGGSTGPWFCVWHDCPPVEGGKARHYGESLGCISISTTWFHTEAEAIAAWNTRAERGSEINGDTSDGYHTFNELYHHRAVLFSVIVRDHRELAWKAMKHHDGTMYDGMFIVGIETPKGQATYHYDLDPYWEMFDCEEREFAPEWDGHTPDEAIARIAELSSEPPYDELLRCLKNDWHISASWDGLRKFWCIELTELGVKLRDAELNERAERTCEVESKIFIEGEYVPCPYYEYEMECGGQFRWDDPEPPNHCPNCGAKVRNE